MRGFFSLPGILFAVFVVICYKFILQSKTFKKVFFGIALGRRGGDEIDKFVERILI